MANVEGWGEFLRNEAAVYHDYSEYASPVFSAAEAAQAVWALADADGRKNIEKEAS
jgi:hypothetical protein